MLGRMRAAAAGVDGSDWRAVMLSDLESYLNMLAEQPDFAWSLHISATLALFGAAR